MGPVLYRLRTSAEAIVIVATLLAHECPLPVIVRPLGLSTDER
jgi:hypothetical protein